MKEVSNWICRRWWSVVGGRVATWSSLYVGSRFIWLFEFDLSWTLMKKAYFG